MNIIVTNAESVKITIRGTISTFNNVKYLEINDEKIIFKDTANVEINLDNKIVSLENVKHLTINRNDIVEQIPCEEKSSNNKVKENRVLFVNNIPFGINIQEVKHLFCKYGGISHIKYISERLDNNKVMITYDDHRDRIDAENDLKDKKIELYDTILTC